MSQQDTTADSVDLRDPESYRHWSAISIRYRDEDQLRHVNNAVYSEWFEVARVKLSRMIAEAGPDWMVTALVRMTIEFVGETGFPGEVRVGGRLLAVGNRSFRSAYGCFRDGNCLATADCVSVYFDPRNRCSVSPPADVRAAMLAELRRSGGA